MIIVTTQLFIVLNLPAMDACGFEPVLQFIKLPVPIVTLTSPTLKQHCPNMAAC